MCVIRWGVLSWQPFGPAEDDAAVCASSAAPECCGGQRRPLLALRGIAVHRSPGGGDHTRGRGGRG